MPNKPIFVATHPRACSTAFERVFMTRRDLKCIHEPFGDAYYFGPERLGRRYERDEQARQDSGFSKATYKSIFDDIMACKDEGKQIVIKDITHYLIPPERAPPSIAPSLQASPESGNERSDNGHVKQDSLQPMNFDKSRLHNPTVLPRSMLDQFTYAFLIRHPKHSIPSYWRCTIPPLSDTTGFHKFMPCEAGYDEQRRFFDYVCQQGLAGKRACVIDADDLLDDPVRIMHKFCDHVGIDFHPDMLVWDTDEDHQIAKDAFEKWRGFHCDAIDSSGLHARQHKKPETTPQQDYSAWVDKYGQEAADVIRDTVEQNTPDYLYLKQFAIKA